MAHPFAPAATGHEAVLVEALQRKQVKMRNDDKLARVGAGIQHSETLWACGGSKVAGAPLDDLFTGQERAKEPVVCSLVPLEA